MSDELEIRREYEPVDDEDRVRRALAILLDEEPRERPGEAA